MTSEPPKTILCITSYEKGQDFIRECKQQGYHVILLIPPELEQANWPRESIDEVFQMPDLSIVEDVINGVSYLARTRSIYRIVALDEFDMENVAGLREHLRVPGMGQTAVRYFRDKLAMRGKARQSRSPSPRADCSRSTRRCWCWRWRRCPPR